MSRQTVRASTIEKHEIQELAISQSYRGYTETRLTCEFHARKAGLLFGTILRSVGGKQA